MSQFWKRVIVQADTMSNKKKMFRKRKKKGHTETNMAKNHQVDPPTYTWSHIGPRLVF